MTTHCIILDENDDALVTLCGISVIERLLRTLQRCALTKVTLLSSKSESISTDLTKPSWARSQLQLSFHNLSSNPATVESLVTAWPEAAQSAIVVRSDVVLDVRLLRLLLAQNETSVLVDSTPRPDVQALAAKMPDTRLGKFCGVALIEHDWIRNRSGAYEQALLADLEGGTIETVDVREEPFYSTTLRRNARPFWFPTPAVSQRKAAENILLDSSQKGSLDIPAMIHAPIERFLISNLCRTPITPNQLTVFCNVVAWITTVLFATGHLTLGIVLALIVGVLDGLDGKQARIKLETSKSGKLEHWFDALFEWSWWISLACYFQFSGRLPTAFVYLALLIVGEGLDGIAKAVVYFTTGKIIDELGAFERLVRLVGGRRNVYVWILAIAILLGAPARGFMVMAWLEVATALVHLPRAIWTLYESRNKRAAAPSS